MTKDLKLHNVGKTIFSTNSAGKIGQLHVKKMKLDHSLTSFTKKRTKWIKDLNVRPDTIKLKEGNIGRTLSGIDHFNIFFSLSPRAMEIKAKVNKWDLHKLKSFSEQRKQQNEMTTHRLGGNICKLCDQ